MSSPAQVPPHLRGAAARAYTRGRRRRVALVLTLAVGLVVGCVTICALVMVGLDVLARGETARGVALVGTGVTLLVILAALIMLYPTRRGRR